MDYDIGFKHKGFHEAVLIEDCNNILDAISKFYHEYGMYEIISITLD
jgi:hypothetical protein